MMDNALRDSPPPNATGFDPHDWPFFWMTQAVGRYLQRLETALKRVELDVSRWRVLMCLKEGKPTTMTKIVQRMQADGLVTCEARASDGRVTEVSLTDRGLAARQEAWTIANKLYVQAFRTIADDDKHRLNRLVESIFNNLSEW